MAASGTQAPCVPLDSPSPTARDFASAALEELGRLRCDAVAALSLDAYTAALQAALEKAASQTLAAAAEELPVVHWLLCLPDRAAEASLPYTAAHAHTVWLRMRRHFGVLAGAGRDATVAAAVEKMHAAVRRRLQVTADSPPPAQRVQAEVAPMAEGLRGRLQLQGDWVCMFLKHALPVRDAVNLLAVVFLYSVDFKSCACESLVECEAKPKHRVKPPPPPHPAAQGHRSEVWAVLNWVSRVTASERERDALDDEGRAVLKCTRELLEPYAADLERALKVLPPCRMKVVFRGLATPLAHEYRVGCVVSLPSFTSTSHEGEEALHFMDTTRPGTFYIFRLHSARNIDFLSAYPEQSEALLSRNCEFVVKSKFPRTVLRLLRCRFDIVILSERGIVTSADEAAEALVRSAGQTAFLYRAYLSGLAPTRVAAAAGAVEGLIPAVDAWLGAADGPRHALISGDAGGGKTSAGLQVLSHVIGARGGFALFVSLAAVKELYSPGALDRHVFAQLDLDASGWEALLHCGDVVLLFDSLDENADATALRVGGLGLLDRNPECCRARVVVTTRGELLKAAKVDDVRNVVRTGAGREEVIAWTVQPLSDGDVQALIAAAVENTPKVREQRPHSEVARAAALERAVAYVAALPAELRQHPLLLSMALAVMGGGAEALPRTRRELYDAYLAHCVSGLPDCTHVMEQMEGLGMHMLSTCAWQVTVAEAKRIMGCDSAGLEVLPVRVEDVSDDASMLSLEHRTLAEYLAARRLARAPGDIEAATDAIPASVKRGVLVFLLEWGDEVVVAKAAYPLLMSCRDPAPLLEPLARQLEEMTARYGPDDVRLAETMMILAAARGMTKSESKQKAGMLLKRAFAVQKAHYGDDHIELARTMRFLGYAAVKMNDYPNAKVMFEQALALQERHLGPDHADIPETLTFLGAASQHCGDYHALKRHLERALVLLEKHYGPHNARLREALDYLGVAYAHFGDVEKDFALLKRALAIAEAHFGPDSPNIVRELNSLADSCNLREDWSKAEEYATRALALASEPSAKTLDRLGKAKHGLKDYKGAIEYGERAIALRIAHHGGDNVSIVAPLLYVSDAYGEVGDHARHLELAERALFLDEAEHGKSHRTLIPTLHNLENACKSVGDHVRHDEVQARRLALESGLPANERG